VTFNSEVTAISSKRHGSVPEPPSRSPPSPPQAENVYETVLPCSSKESDDINEFEHLRRCYRRSQSADVRRPWCDKYCHKQYCKENCDYESKKQNHYSRMPPPSSSQRKKHQRCSSCSSSESDGDDVFLLNYLAASFSQSDKIALELNMKLTDFFKGIRLIPLPFGLYHENNPEMPPVMVDFREPDKWRTLPIVFSNEQYLYVDRAVISKFSALCADMIDNLEKEEKNLVLKLDGISFEAMERVLFVISPTIYGNYPILPSVFDVDIICPVARALKMDAVIKVCEKILENDVCPDSAPVDIIITAFDTAYQCQLNPTLQAKLLIHVMDCQFWKLTLSLINQIKSPCLRIFLWNFREVKRYITVMKQAARNGRFMRYRRAWTEKEADAESAELFRLCVYTELLFNHVTVTTPMHNTKLTCAQCDEESLSYQARVNAGRRSNILRIVPERLFFCQQCNMTLCSVCEAKCCVSKVSKYLDDVRKAEKSPKLLRKLKKLVKLNSSNNDVIQSLLISS
ncbi:unnamed protein product, partial [Thelazia callipaeda]|uniref:BTB domain-containing protein n=1 Tax=Thelazia callipaeda TaxID=103827 RepID=A0A0N5DAS3_THECL